MSVDNFVLSSPLRVVPRVDSEVDALPFVPRHQPAILTCEQACSVEEFVERFGEVSIGVSEDPAFLVRTQGAVSVRDYWDEIRASRPATAEPVRYGFHDVLGLDRARYQPDSEGGHAAGAALEAFVMSAELPAFFVTTSGALECVGARLAFGPPGSGADLHTHGPALNQLLAGEKRWRLFHPYVAELIRSLVAKLRADAPLAYFDEEVLPSLPDESVDVSRQVRQIFDELARRGDSLPPNDADPLWHVPMDAALLRGLCAVQKPGDRMCVPNRWAHAVKNTSYALARVFELEAPTERTRMRAVNRDRDGEGAAVLRNPRTVLAESPNGTMLVGDGAARMLEPIVSELFGLIDGNLSARELAERSSNPRRAADVLDELAEVFPRALVG
jgi:hypothetical protein